MISLQVQNLAKKFNRNIIFQGLNLEHSEGVLGIAGANGSGKSTLMKCLSYLLRPAQGEILWRKDNRLLDQKHTKQLMGFAAPYINLYAELSVEENLVFLVEAGGKAADRNHLMQVLEKVQVLHLRKQSYGSLSTGQQQRVKLASALIRDPEILLLDEPGSNLDENGHELVQDLVNEAKAKDRLVILASNDPNEIILCDKVVEL